MKKSTLALVVMGIVASASVQAAEIYNKDGNKLDVYGVVGKQSLPVIKQRVILHSKKRVSLLPG